MEGHAREELEKLMFFEQHREAAEADWRANNNDAQALTRWGGALLELAHFRQGSDSVELIEQAVSKLEAAIKLNSRKHDALWCLGNALTSQGFLYPDAEQANKYFSKAKDCFQRALDLEPWNETYQKAFQLTAKAPQLHEELQKQLAQQQAQQESQMGGGQGGSRKGKEPVDENEWAYDYLGWVVLVGLAVGWVWLARPKA